MTSSFQSRLVTVIALFLLSVLLLLSETSAQKGAGGGVLPTTHDCRSKDLPITDCCEGTIFIDPNLKEGVIPFHAFEHCFLTQISIPNTIKHIGNAAFYDNKRLNYVTIPSSVETIGHSSFKSNQLKTVDFSVATSLQRIGERAFQNNKLTRVEIPASVTQIGTYAFEMNPLIFACYHGEVAPKLDKSAFPEGIELSPCSGGKKSDIDL